jgi:hypothetical protein
LPRERSAVQDERHVVEAEALWMVVPQMQVLSDGETKVHAKEREKELCGSDTTPSLTNKEAA